jgi:hypothetical protein
VAAAGLDPEKLGLHTFWDKDRVIKEIKELKRRRLPLYPIDVMKSHPELFSAANRQYRSWAKALRAAGLTRFEVRSRVDLLCKLREGMESGQAISKGMHARIRVLFRQRREGKGRAEN